MPASRGPQDILFQQALAGFQQMNTEISNLRVELEKFKAVVEPVATIVRGEGPVHSLSTQIEVIKTVIMAIEAKVKSGSDKLDALEERLNKSHGEDKKGKWAVYAAIITGAISLLATIATAVLAHATK